MHEHRPDLERDLARIIRNRRRKNPTVIYGFPENDDEAAAYFIALFSLESQARNDHLTRVYDHILNKMVYLWAYYDLMTSRLTAFLLLPKEDQQIITGCAQDGVYWRPGDTMDFLFSNDKSLYNEIMAKKEKK